MGIPPRLVDVSSTTTRPTPSATRRSAPTESASPGVVWSVGEVGKTLGLPASTLRTWERRYGLTPSVRTQGGHRRYDSSDVERLRMMSHLVAQGVAPSEAARAASRVHLRHPEAGAADLEWLDHVIAAAQHFDPQRLVKLFHHVVADRGMVSAWTDYLTPALVRVGDEWARGSIGVDSEHLVSESVLTVLRSYINHLTVETAQPQVMLACAEEEQHAIPVLALQAALAESGTPAHALGPRLPSAALANMAARTKPRVIFLWATMERSPHDRSHRVLEPLSRSSTLMVGGPGWDKIDLPSAVRCDNLPTTLAAIHERIG